MDEIGKALELKDHAIGMASLDVAAGGAAAADDAQERPLFDEFYDDWASFDLAVASAIEKFHPIRKRSSLTFEVYNRTVSKGRHDRKPIAEFLSKTFKCTHGIKFRSRGTGKRSRHKLRDIGCPFHIYATAIEDGAGGYRVKVRTHDKHNHPIGPDAIKTVGALHDSDYEYATDAHAAAVAAAAMGVGVSVGVSDATSVLVDTTAHVNVTTQSGLVSSPPSDGDLQAQLNSYSAHAAAQLHAHHHQQQQHQVLHGHANAADILDTNEQDSEALLQGAIESHINDFQAAAAAVAAAAAAAAASETSTEETAASSARLLESGSKFEGSTTLEGLRRKLSQFADDRDWDQFHSPRNLLIALAGELGELCECFQWKGDNKPVEEWSNEERVHLGEEISDVMMYLILLADKCDIDLPTAIHDKMAKNARRFPADVVRGSAKKYNEFKRPRIDREASL